MSYRVPPAEVIAIAVCDVLREHGPVPRSACSPFRPGEAGYINDDYTVTVRKIALSGLVRVEIAPGTLASR